LKDNKPFLNAGRNIRCVIIALGLEAGLFFVLTLLLSGRGSHRLLISMLWALIVLFGVFFAYHMTMITKDYKCVEHYFTCTQREDISMPVFSKGDTLPEQMQKMEDYANQFKSCTDNEFYSDYLLKRAQFVTLQKQINPHFLYNTLDSIRGQALKDETPVVADMVGALSSLFRYSISKSDDMVLLEEELENIDNYFLIHQYRFENRYALYKEIENESLILGIEVPKLTIQPIVENAIFHGFDSLSTSTQGIVKIHIYPTDNRLYITIEDNGKGIMPETVNKLNASFLKKQTVNTRDPDSSGTGLALLNINHRIKLFYGDEYGMHVYSTIDYGTQVEITIPLPTA